MSAYLDAYGAAATALAPIILVGLALLGAAVLAFNGGIALWVVVDQALLRIRPRAQDCSVDELLDGDDWARDSGYAPGRLDEQSEDWIFDAPEFQTADADRTETVLFAAAVMADIDDWTDGGDAA